MEGRMDEVWWKMLNEVEGGKVLSKVKKIKLSLLSVHSAESIPNVFHNLDPCPLSDQTCIQKRTYLDPFPRQHKSVRTALNCTNVLFLNLRNAQAIKTTANHKNASTKLH